MCNITKEEILGAQKKWAEGLIRLGTFEGNREQCLAATADYVDRMYAYSEGLVLFKPTRARRHQFRFDIEGAILH